MTAPANNSNNNSNHNNAAAAAPLPPAPPVAPPSSPPTSQSLSSWFAGAPLTKLLAYTAVGSYVLTHSSHFRVQQHTLLLDQWSVSTLAELLIGVVPLLCVLSRQWEREMGSRHFGKLLAAALIVAYVLRTFLFVPMHDDEGRRLTLPGLYPLLGATFGYYHLYTPRLHPRFVNAFGLLHFSEKSLYYVWLMVALTRGSGSGGANGNGGTIPWHMCDFGAGLLAGLLFRYLPPHVHLVPDRIVSWVARGASRFLEAPPPILVPQYHHLASGSGSGSGGRGGGGGRDALPPAPPLVALQPSFSSSSSRRVNPLAPQAAAMGATRGIGGGGRHAPSPLSNNNNNNAPAPAPPIVVDPDAVEQLVHMGFDRDRVIQALRVTRNDVARAADVLLSHSQ